MHVLCIVQLPRTGLWAEAEYILAVIRFSPDTGLKPTRSGRSDDRTRPLASIGSADGASRGEGSNWDTEYKCRAEIRRERLKHTE